MSRDAVNSDDFLLTIEPLTIVVYLVFICYVLSYVGHNKQYMIVYVRPFDTLVIAIKVVAILSNSK